MAKRILSLLGVVSVLSTMAVSTAFAVATTLTFTLSRTSFDPGDLDTTKTSVVATYSIDEANVSVKMDVKNSADAVVYSGTSTSAATFDGTFTWDGKSAGAFVKEGDYKVYLSYGTLKSTPEYKTVSVDYKSGLEPNITTSSSSGTVGLSSDIATIDPVNEDVAAISFYLDNDSIVKAGVYDSTGKLVFTPDLGEDNSDSDDNDEMGGEIDFEWDGTDGICYVAPGVYNVKVTALNDNGYTEASTSLTVAADTTTQCIESSSRAKIVSSDPSTTWDPIVDGKLDIDYDVVYDGDDDWDFQILALKGSEEIELYSESNPDSGEESVSWDGSDDSGDYLESGTWRIVAVSTFDTDTKTFKYYHSKNITVKYETPSIDEAFVTKTEIDPELGDGVYFAFMLEDDDANVDVEVLRGSSSRVDLLEDQRIEADKWYAVYWDGFDDDGDSFDYDDTFKIRLTAKSLGDEDVSVSKTYSIDLDEDVTSSTKANIFKDVVVPPVVSVDGNITLSYTLNSSAEVSVGVYDGTSTSGSPDVELSAAQVQSSGDYSVTWNLEDEDGNAASSGYYTYKISAKKTGSSSVETETGKFRVGAVGEVFGEPDEEEETPVVVDEEGCGFVDVSATNPNCAAIKWNKDNGVVLGNSDGTFKPYSPINRVEVLAIILRAFDLGLFADDGTTLGWSDVTVGAWYMPYLKTGYTYGLISGDAGKTTVRPSDSVSRVEFLKLAYEALSKVRGVNTSFCSSNPYSDVPLGAWYTNYACQAKDDSLFDVSFGMFMPGKSATRGEVAEALYRLLK